MKKILAILLTVIVIATIFIGCSKESEPVNGTTEPSSVETVDEIVDNLTEDVSIEDTTTDEDGNEVLVGKDTDDNTVEIKKDKDGKVTKTVTDKETGKKTEQTTTVSTTKKSETATKKKSEETTKKPETTAKKPASQTQSTTVPKTTSTHTHKFVKKSKQVLVKAAWDEDIYETKQKMEEMQCFYCSGCHVDCIAEANRLGYSNYQEFHVSHSMGMDGLSCPQTYGNGYQMLLGTSFGAPTSKMYPVYENGKPVYEKVKTGTKHHDAEYRTEYWEECSCGAKR
ncbi:MAG: hypothetical protein K2I14_04445 [Eubacterium sp.]|nr:hypothetical protein [Eubacterium sp.]